MFIDRIFLALTAFALSFTWLRYYIDDNSVCLLGAVAAVTLLLIVIKAVWGGRKSKKRLKRQELKETEKLTAYLCFLPQDKTLALLKTIEPLKNAVPAADGLTFSDGENTVEVTARFSASPFTAGEFCGVVKNSSADRIDIFACKFDKDVHPLAKVSPVEARLFDIKATYALLKKHGALPPCVTSGGKRPLTANFWETVFNRSRAKYYLMSSMFLIITAFLTFFRLYYLITGTLLFLLFIYARFNTRFNHTTAPKGL